MTSSQQDATPCQWFSYLASALERRSAPSLVWLFLGALLARGASSGHGRSRGGAGGNSFDRMRMRLGSGSLPRLTP